MIRLFLRTLLPMLFFVAALGGTNARAQGNTWIGPETGDWAEAENWSLGEWPNDGQAAVRIDDNPHQASTVELRQQTTIASLAIDAGDTLHILETGWLTTTSSLANSGTLSLAGPFTQQRLNAIGSLLNLNGGLIEMDEALLRAVGLNALLWNQSTMAGSGSILNFSVRNEGLLEANRSGGLLTVFATPTSVPVEAQALVNSGTLRARSGGELQLRRFHSGILNEQGDSSGSIEAWGDSHVVILDSRVVGGTLVGSTTGGVEAGMFYFGDTVSLEGVTLQTDSKFFPNSYLSHSTLSNQGTMTFDAMDPAPRLLGENVFSGGGQIRLSHGVDWQGENFSQESTPRLVNQDNTIVMSGFGQATLGGNLAVENYGTIEVLGEPAQLDLLLSGPDTIANGSPAWENRGLIRATEGGTLRLQGNGSNRPLDNTGGIVSFDLLSTVQLSNNAHLFGGVLRGPTSTTSQHFGLDGNGILEDIRLEGFISSQHGLVLKGNIENAGTLSVQSSLNIDEQASISGGGELQLRSVVPIGSGDNSKLVNEDNTIKVDDYTGFDQLTLVNRGVIESDSSSASIEFNSPSQQSGLVNSGVVRAIDGAYFHVAPGGGDYIQNYEVRDNGELVAGKLQAGVGSTLELRGVVGGTLQAAEQATVRVEGGLLNLSTTPGEMLLLGTIEAHNVQFGGTIRNEGHLLLGNSSRASGFVRLLGNGELIVQDQITFFPSGGIFLHGPSHTITGQGQILLERSYFFNEGRIEARLSENLNILNNQGLGTFLQQGELFARDDGHLNIAATFPMGNQGLISSEDNALISLRYGGSFRNHDQVSIGPGAQITLHGDASTSNDDVFVNTAGAEVVVDGTLLLARTQFVNEQGGILRGSGNIEDRSGRIRSPFLNHGIISPGDTLGPLTFEQEVILSESSLLQISFGETEEGAGYNSLYVFGPATLGGELQVVLDPTFELSTGDFFPLVSTTEGIFFEFDSTSLPQLDDGKQLRLVYGETIVGLEVFAHPDFNGDGIVDGLDLTDPTLGWQARYGHDLKGSNFLDWQRNFHAVAPFQLIPEPHSIWLLVSAVLTGAVTRRQSR